MQETPPEEAEKFVQELRKEIGFALEAVRIRTISSFSNELLSPATVSAALVLSAADYCLKQGCTMAQFLAVLKTYAATLEELTGVKAEEAENG